MDDELGRPVNGATVSFLLPSGGPGGAFATGGRNEIISTRADGRATVWGMQWNRIAGPFEIRITAAKGQARAGILCTQYLSDGRVPGAGSSAGDAQHRDNLPIGGTAQEARGLPTSRGTQSEYQLRSGGHRWLWITLGVAALAVGGAAAIGRASTQEGSSTTATSNSVQIGTPSLTLGRP